MASHLEEHDDSTDDHYPDDRRMQQYGNLFFLLQSEPRHIATLCRLVNLAEIDTLLQTVMFTLYGNQYESREEHLLLTMFQVRYTFKKGHLIMGLTTISLECLGSTIRDDSRVYIIATCQYTCFSYDDDLYSTWTRSILSEISIVGQNQRLD